MVGPPKTESKLRLARITEELDNRTTQPFRRPVLRVAHERVRPNPLFRRVAELLGCAHDDACQQLAPAMTRAEATPQAFQRDHLVAIAPSILDLIEIVLPAESRQQARDRLRSLLLEENPPA